MKVKFGIMILFRVVVSWKIDAPIGGESLLRKPCLTRATTDQYSNLFSTFLNLVYNSILLKLFSYNLKTYYFVSPSGGRIY